MKRKALSTYTTYRRHFEALCVECDDALRAIDEAFKKWL